MLFYQSFSYSCIKLSGMQSSTFTINNNISRHSALYTCYKYSSQKNSHKNLNFPKFFACFVCTLTMQCLPLRYVERECIQNCSVEIFSHKMFYLDGMATLLLSSSHLHKAEFNPETLMFSSGPDVKVGGGQSHVTTNYLILAL